MEKTTMVACPICQTPVAWRASSLYRPFCSERCKNIDLAAWADGSYAIPASDQPADDSHADDSHAEDHPMPPTWH